MRSTVAIILGGGKGTRLFPLTQHRSKPAVPIAAKYRLIDVPISNCINSTINRIYLLTQFNSVSLHRHIRQTYNFDRFNAGFVEILAAQQTLEGTDWYQGTADAVRKQLRYVEQPGVKHVLILSGDQLYRMNYKQMLKTHIDSNADVTISTVPVNARDAKSFGIMRLDETGQVQGFLEKPQTDKDLKIVRTDPDWIDQQGIESKGREYLASMGIYLFNRDVLVDLLKGSDYEDFGKEVFPMAIRARKVQCHLFDGYWEDIGTIRAFYDANLALAKESPPFDLTDDESPIYSRARFLPPTRIDDVSIKSSLIADGCSIGSGTVIENSIIGLRCRIGKNVTIRNSILMGSDFFQNAEEMASDKAEGRVPLGIGDDCIIDGAIVDKNVRISPGVRIEAANHAAELNEDPITIRDGIAVVARNAELFPGWKLGGV
ncbi:UNVERIFIED_CONTAM: hypothetical protein GTU68_039077 [Idotea baltica]|nr:hypothetical protein [Idotea baltica]